MAEKSSKDDSSKENCRGKVIERKVGREESWTREKLVERKIGREAVWSKEEWSADNWPKKRGKLANDSLVEGDLVENKKKSFTHSHSLFLDLGILYVFLSLSLNLSQQKGK